MPVFFSSISPVPGPMLAHSSFSMSICRFSKLPVREHELGFMLSKAVFTAIVRVEYFMQRVKNYFCSLSIRVITKLS